MKKNLLLISLSLFVAIQATAKEGLYIEFKMSGAQYSGSYKLYSCDGNTRSEIKIKGPAMPNSLGNVMLSLKSSPDSTYMVSEKDKTYSMAKSWKNPAQENNAGDYEIKIIGKEKISNYNCVHVSIHDNGTKTEREMWLTKDVAGWAKYAALNNSFVDGPYIFDALKAKGAEGYIVRMVSNQPNGDKIQADLVTAEKRDIKESLFSVKGYTRVVSGVPPPRPRVPQQAKPKQVTQEKPKKTP